MLDQLLEVPLLLLQDVASLMKLMTIPLELELDLVLLTVVSFHPLPLKFSAELTLLIKKKWLLMTFMYS